MNQELDVIPLAYSVRSLWARRVVTGLTVLGLSLVVFVFAAVLMLAHGIEDALRSGGSPRNVVVLREGATAEIVSGVDRADVRALATMPELAQGPDGRPIAAVETVVLVALPRFGGAFINATARGIDEASWLARPEVRISTGRPPRPGTNEVALGSALVGRTEGAFIGGELSFAQQRWPVVGVLASAGSAFESELWVDGDRLAQAYRREVPSSAVLRLRTGATVPDFRRRVEDDARFELKLVDEESYWADQAAGTATFIRVLGLFVSIVFGIGAVLGAMITMYAQVAARVRELGTLRAVGFRRRSVLAAVVVESLLLGATGGVAGSGAAILMRFVKISTLNFQTFSQVRFGFTPTPGIVAAALLFGAGMGLVGGLLPAVRAARLQILDALRA